MVFELLCVRTAFHSGRLLATTAYGAPGITAGQENIFVNDVMEFNGDNSWNSFRVNYNSATEFLRTYEGVHAPDQVQDFSMGFVSITVANVLRASSEVVANAVDVLLFVRLENVRVYEPKLFPLVEFDSSSRFAITNFAPAIVAEDEEEKFEAEGPTGEPVEDVPTVGGSAETTVVANTASESPIQANMPCRLDIGRHFEYCVTDIHELLRRHSLKSKLIDGAATLYMPSPGPNYNLAYIPVKLYTHWAGLFSAWSGHVKFRIYVYGSEPGMVAYNSHPGSITTKWNSGAVMGNSAATLSTWSGTTFVTANGFADYHQPMEMMYQIANGVSMIDVSIPFNSQYNMLPTREDNFNSSHTTTNGVLILRYPATARYEVFQAAGDDFRYQVFCPQVGIQARSANASGGVDPTTFANTEIMGNMY